MTIDAMPSTGTVISDQELHALILRLVDRGIQFRVNSEGEIKVKAMQLATTAERMILADCRDRVRAFLLDKVGVGGKLDKSIPQGNGPIPCTDSPTVKVTERKAPDGYTYSRDPNTHRIIARNQIVAKGDMRDVRERRRAFARKLAPESTPGFTLHYGPYAAEGSQDQPRGKYHGQEGVEEMIQDANRQVAELRRR